MACELIVGERQGICEYGNSFRALDIILEKITYTSFLGDAFVSFINTIKSINHHTRQTKVNSEAAIIEKQDNPSELNDTIVKFYLEKNSSEAKYTQVK